MIIIQPSGLKFNQTLFTKFVNDEKMNIEKEYFDFLNEYNGGRPEGNILEIQNSEFESISINFFSGVGLDYNNNLLTQYSVFKDRIPKNYLPIARAEGGNKVCICTKLSSPYFGKIFLWDHDTEHLFHLANSFVEFLNIIKSYDPPEEELDGYTIISGR